MISVFRGLSVRYRIITVGYRIIIGETPIFGLLRSFYTAVHCVRLCPHDLCVERLLVFYEVRDVSDIIDSEGLRFGRLSGSVRMGKVSEV